LRTTRPKEQPAAPPSGERGNQARARFPMRLVAPSNHVPPKHSLKNHVAASQVTGKLFPDVKIGKNSMRRRSGAGRRPSPPPVSMKNFPRFFSASHKIQIANYPLYAVRKPDQKTTLIYFIPYIRPFGMMVHRLREPVPTRVMFPNAALKSLPLVLFVKLCRPVSANPGMRLEKFCFISSSANLA